MLALTLHTTILRGSEKANLLKQIISDYVIATGSIKVIQ